jgi:hypothetical protein
LSWRQRRPPTTCPLRIEAVDEAREYRLKHRLIAKSRRRETRSDRSRLRAGWFAMTRAGGTRGRGPYHWLEYDTSESFQHARLSTRTTRRMVRVRPRAQRPVNAETFRRTDIILSCLYQNALGRLLCKLVHGRSLKLLADHAPPPRRNRSVETINSSRRQRTSAGTRLRRLALQSQRQDAKQRRTRAGGSR